LSGRKTKFGILLRDYREERNLTIRGLQEKLEQGKYGIGYSALDKYELGQRHPRGQAVYAISVCLELNEAETEALLSACVADLQLEILREYKEAVTQNEKEPKRNEDTL
jgi:hypothetical protein